MLNQFRDVFASFEKHDVKYVIIGGVAAVIHGVPRMTFDLDILIEATPSNATALLDALTEAGLGTASLLTALELLLLCLKTVSISMCRRGHRAYRLRMHGSDGFVLITRGYRSMLSRARISLPPSVRPGAL